jgi:hypothetical protein
MPSEIALPEFSANIYEMVPRTITEAFRVLLDARHLYQSVEIPPEHLHEAILEAARAMNPVIDPGVFEKNTYNSLLAMWLPKWILAPGLNDPPPVKDYRNCTMFDLPTVETFCELCTKDQPFNPQPRQIGQFFPFPPEPWRKPKQQVFALAYLCQGCKEFELSFMVTRKEMKLTLSGRSVIEHMQVPPYVPKPVARFYSGAVIAYNCNQVLPGLFMLRTLVEQYMRLMLAPAAIERAEKIVDEYNASLDVTFKSRFPSLPEVYGKLSDALHEARDDGDLFESQIEEINNHLSARKSWEEDRKTR